MSKRAKVSELEAPLSGYLARVRGGESIVVCDRRPPIAVISPCGDLDDPEIREATRPAADLRKVGGVAVAIDAVKLLRDDRDQ